ncbi:MULTISPECIES: cytochrome-c oxidase, cbb3-type subunit III [Pseudomonadota]|uniref:cytochrome-c oxidase, cbb3-type subunit III n=1 Tax=Pseudomonadota TaxID=1224 RepID=UPI001A0F908F|nr:MULTISPECIES: cytochrome-c oxidase, cbb3-type subunit III [Pseudomonadota]MBF0673698.1 cytochrome-c oxidase, cbb3-type subunit III [Pseudomonas sp.]WEJ33185.1 cytochrome-c oxidase, cbb3-type subunit III [Devosia sp. SD17-2]
MSKTEIDPVSGEQTTGHEWNGIKELDTPVPRGILWFIVVTHLFALVWWVLMPAFPLGWTYTKGILGIDQRETVEQVIVGNQRARQPWTSQIAALPFDQIQADEALMTNVAQSGRQLFGDNCAACHGLNGTGRSSYPDLTDGDWLWGDGSPEAIAETLRVGINTRHDESRTSQMPAFGRDATLSRPEVRQVAQYVYSMSQPEYSTVDNVDTIAAGQQLFIDNCSGCHGESGAGIADIGAPNLTDAAWLYGGTIEDIIESVHGGRTGHMPTWDERLTATEIKTLALYVYVLGMASP